jgi:hypothetical protein
MSDSPKKHFSVAASPFNEVKLDLAIGFLIAIILFILLEYSGLSSLVQLGVLAGYATTLTVWIIWRIRRVTREVMKQGKQSDSGPGEGE